MMHTCIPPYPTCKVANINDVAVVLLRLFNKIASLMNSSFGCVAMPAECLAAVAASAKSTALLAELDAAEAFP